MQSAIMECRACECAEMFPLSQPPVRTCLVSESELVWVGARDLYNRRGSMLDPYTGLCASPAPQHQVPSHACGNLLHESRAHALVSPLRLVAKSFTQWAQLRV